MSVASANRRALRRLIFFLLALALWTLLAMPRERGGLPAREGAYVWAFALTALAGLSDELHQELVAWRHGDPIDLLTDLAAAGGVIWLMLGMRAGRSERELWWRFGVLCVVTFLTSMWAK